MNGGEYTLGEWTHTGYGQVRIYLDNGAYKYEYKADADAVTPDDDTTEKIAVSITDGDTDVYEVNADGVALTVDEAGLREGADTSLLTDTKAIPLPDGVSAKDGTYDLFDADDNKVGEVTVSGGNATYTLDANKLIHSGGGNDVLSGGEGDDFLYGGSGNDLIHGGAGDDIMFGGAGNDTFAWQAGDYGSGTDTIMDFKLGEDVLRFDDIFGVTGENQLESLITSGVEISLNPDVNMITLKLTGAEHDGQEIEIHMNATDYAAVNNCYDAEGDNAALLQMLLGNS